MPTRYRLFYTPRIGGPDDRDGGAWGKSFRLNIFQEGMEGWAAGAEANVTWYPHEAFNLNFRLNP